MGPSHLSQPIRDKARAIHKRLEAEYGHHPWQPRYDPVSELVYTILSQNTSDVNSLRAFQRLRDSFADWERVLESPVDKIERAISVAGLSAIKAPRIKTVLTLIADKRGALNLDFLKDMDATEARAWLKALPGIGPKTAAIVLLFSLGIPALPVDTHVYRVSRRLGLIGERESLERAHEVLESLVPPQDYLDFHVNVLTHGREVCHARNPKCGVCIVNKLCNAYQRFVEEGVAIR